MMSSMMSGISGLRNHQTAMDVIGNNIANVNTSGFKASRVLFKQVFSSTMANATAPNSENGIGGTNPMQVGMGSAISSIDMLYTEGNIERTDNPLDVSIDGDGLFIIKESDTSTYTFTRAGAFGVDKNGNLKTASGALVCGWQKRIDSDELGDENVFATTMDVEPINIYRDIYNGNKQIIDPQPTTRVVFSGNLNANTETDEVVGVPLTLYDNYGNEIQASLNFTKLENVSPSNSIFKDKIPAGKVVDANGVEITDWEDTVQYVVPISGGKYQKVDSSKIPNALKIIEDDKDYVYNKWKYEVLVNGKPVTKEENGVEVPVGGFVEFSNSEGEGFGKLTSITDLGGKPIEDFKLEFIAKYDSTPDNTTEISFDFSSVTQFSAKDSVYVYDTDGYKTGTLTEYSIGGDGVITGIYTNGKQQALGVIALASFENYSGLKSVGDSAYSETANSGVFRAVPPGADAGTLTSNTLEMSNVDLSTEFTNMIIYQRGFQANSRGITVADEMLQELVNLKR